MNVVTDRLQLYSFLPNFFKLLIYYRRISVLKPLFYTGSKITECNEIINILLNPNVICC